MNTTENPELSRAWKSTEKSTGYSRQQWMTVLEETELTSHAEIVGVARKKLGELAEQPGSLLAGKNLDWWAQSVAVTYEQQTGRRPVGQRCDGSFGASASKTIPLGLDELAAAWEKFAAAELPEVNGVAWEGEPRITSSEKWRYWRANLANGAPVSINMSAKAPGKSLISAEMRKLNTSEDSVDFKAAWKAVLARFAQSIA
ncbi:hypothetical protein [Rothia aerolata]|uniref:DUF4287 domain-containing protein n=1 Tax=Rothia aerolata TaxID=1812262 RepID=A0A917INP9_9MICC|nr:hypothetical protein [Rothia aerolata]GGH58075.1 hypothetical protein GCM10007359_03870 [Rothia aerolata]